MTLFGAAVEGTVVSTAMPTVVGDLGGLHLYSWVFAAYMLTSTVSVPIYGKLADLHGRKPILLFGIAVFLLGSVASGLAQNMEQLVLFRALQGLGAGAMQPMVMTLVGDLFTLHERARVQGIIGSVWGMSGIAGPAMGAFLVKWLSWHWVFFINVPAGLCAMVILVVFLKEEVAHREHALDYAGAALLTVSVLVLLGAADATLPRVAGLAAGGALLATFIAVEKRAREPLLPLDLFGQRVILVANVGGAALGAAMTGTVSYVPLFVQGVQGGTPLEAGSAIAPMLIGWPIASTLSGHLVPRLGFRTVARVGFAVAAVATWALAAVASPDVHPWVLRGITAALGVGLGFANTSLLLAVQTSVSWQQRGVATGGTMFFRSMGGTLAVGVMGAVLAAALAAHPEIPAGAGEQLLGPAHGRNLDAAMLQALAGALEDGLGTVFRLVAGIGLVAVCVGWLFPHVPMADARKPG